MFKRATLLCLIVIFLGSVNILYAQEVGTSEDSPKCKPEETRSDCEKRLLQKIEYYNKEIERLKEEKDSLKKQIGLMDTKIYLAKYEIEIKEKEIEDIEGQIESLDKRIILVDQAMNVMSKDMIRYMVETYKQKEVGLLEIVFGTDNLEDAIVYAQYAEQVREMNEKVLLQAQNTKKSYQDQKKHREKIKERLDEVKKELAEFQKNLRLEQSNKKRLLDETNGREEIYQSLRKEAEETVKTLKQFVQSTGVGIIAADALGVGEGGWYLSQRDIRWANMKMGNSNETVFEVGCLITSVSMVLRSKGYDFTPPLIANNPEYFWQNTALARFRSDFNGSWPGGLKSRGLSSLAEVDEQLAKGNPVIAGVNGESHWIVLKSKNASGKYIMNDPIYGPDLTVSDYYNLTGRFEIFE